MQKKYLSISPFIFSKEEANTIIAMIASHMDSLSTIDYHK